MVVSIHQPDYIPYIGYYYKIYKSDIFIFLDDAQYSNNNMHQWNKIKTPQGECRLKIPVKYKFGDLINQVQTRDELNWKEKHLKTLKMNYSKAAFFKEIFPFFQDIIMRDYANLSDMNIEISKWICDSFGFKCSFYRSSELDVHTSKEMRVIDLCIKVGAETYISGNGARAYQVEDHFIKRGIRLQYTDYQPFEYKQLWGYFIPNLSIIDYIFNCGFSNPFINHKHFDSKSIGEKSNGD